MGCTGRSPTVVVENRCPRGAVAARKPPLLVVAIVLALSCSGEKNETVSHRESDAHGIAGREKVILVVIDALRADHLGVHGYGRNTTPTIDRLAREGLHLPHLVVQATQTAPSVASILTSTLPSKHGVQYHSETGNFSGKKNRIAAPVLTSRNVTLAEWIARRGYYTAAVVNNPWLRGELGFGQGFASYSELDCYRPRSRRRSRASARAGTASPAAAGTVCDGAKSNQLAEAILRQHAGERTFLYLHYMDAHSPYAHDGTLPARWREKPGRDAFGGNGPARHVRPEDLAYTMALYDEGIAYADAMIERLLRFLEAENLLAETTLLVTSDHGEEFLEHGGLGHGTSLHHELLQSFAVIWNPGRVEARRLDDRVAAIDLYPTLLGLVGIDRPPEIAGRDVLAPAGAEPPDIVAELADQKALLRGGWKLVLELEPRRSIFGRIDTAGASLGPAGAESARVAESMNAVLDDLIRRASPEEIRPLDAEAESKLRALGYLR